MDRHVDLKKVARNTPGFAGADLENLLNEGALMAARKGKKVVEWNDLEEARDKVAYGRERRKLMDEEDRRITAYHEAGHAMVQAHIDDGLLPVHRVTILPRGRSLGSTMFLPTKDILNQSRHHALNQICCAMGGRISEEIFLGETSSGAAADIKVATELARHMICDWGMGKMGPVALGENVDHIFLGRDITRTQNYSESTASAIDGEIAALIAVECERARKILEEKRSAVETLVRLLLEKETVEGEEIYDLLKDPLDDCQKEKIPDTKKVSNKPRKTAAQT
ncbi:MAG: ATP-dependent metallopeptidase FtsH/Yme1/Tma family protein [Puniceicoccales bacterium]|jgi:cell division protease FtsH|nr:ATP-dependent metallopeptidase FtsH/Yme1/Tma family protein [Puniceicoccales bacterium]